MTKKKAICAIALAVVMTASVMAGCKGNGNTSSTSSNEVVTIKTTYQAGEWSADLVKQFEKDNPNIKLEQMGADNAKIMAMIAAGNGPDFIRCMGVQDIPTYVIRGIALNLDKYFASSKLIKTNDLLKVCYTFKYDASTMTQGKGHWYGLPKDWSADYGLFINKQMFTDAGIAVPDASKPISYATLGDYAKKLTKKDASGTVTQYGYQSLSGTYTYDLALVYAQLQGADVLSKDFKKCELNSAANMNGINWTIDLAKAMAIPSPLSVAPDSGNALFVNGKLAIYQAGYWFSGVLRGYDGTLVGSSQTKMNLSNYMSLPAPTWTDGSTRHSPCGYATGGVIWRNTKHPDQAFKTMEWFFAGPAATDRAKSGFGIPVTKTNFALMPQNTDFDKQTYKVCQDELNYSEPFIQYSPYLQPSAVNSALDKYLSPVYFGKDTVDHAVSQIDTQIDTLTQEGMDIAGLTK